MTHTYGAHSGAEGSASDEAALLGDQMLSHARGWSRGES